MRGSAFLPRKRRYPPHAGQQKSPASKHSRTEYEKTARPLASSCISRSHQQLANIGTQLSKPDRGRRDEPPGLSLSPGAEHSSKAEIAPQQLPKALCHFDSPPFSYNTYLFDWFFSIIPQPHWVVKPFFRLFWWEFGFCEKGKLPL